MAETRTLLRVAILLPLLLCLSFALPRFTLADAGCEAIKDTKTGEIVGYKQTKECTGTCNQWKGTCDLAKEPAPTTPVDAKGNPLAPGSWSQTLPESYAPVSGTVIKPSPLNSADQISTRSSDLEEALKEVYGQEQFEGDQLARRAIPIQCTWCDFSSTLAELAGFAGFTIPTIVPTAPPVGYADYGRQNLMNGGYYPGQYSQGGATPFGPMGGLNAGSPGGLPSGFSPAPSNSFSGEPGSQPSTFAPQGDAPPQNYEGNSMWDIVQKNFDGIISGAWEAGKDFWEGFSTPAPEGALYQSPPEIPSTIRTDEIQLTQSSSDISSLQPQSSDDFDLPPDNRPTMETSQLRATSEQTQVTSESVQRLEDKVQEVQNTNEQLQKNNPDTTLAEAMKKLDDANKTITRLQDDLTDAQDQLSTTKLALAENQDKIRQLMDAMSKQAELTNQVLQNPAAQSSDRIAAVQQLTNLLEGAGAQIKNLEQQLEVAQPPTTVGEKLTGPVTNAFSDFVRWTQSISQAIWNSIQGFWSSIFR